MRVVQSDPYLRLIPKTRLVDLCQAVLSHVSDEVHSDQPSFEPSRKRRKLDYKISAAAVKVIHEAAEAGCAAFATVAFQVL